MSTTGSFVEDVLYLALIVFSALAVLRVLRGKDTEAPISLKDGRWRYCGAKVKTRAAETSRADSSPTAGCADSNAIRTSGATYGFAPDSSIITQDASVPPVPGLWLCPACSPIA